mmetsp:Transcript_18147/g.29303  ORF Transcript_18147/g.29303 Transcript_18147/m.29303 type:complete len:214 (+) Transcript_18147:65-706(+)
MGRSPPCRTVDTRTRLLNSLGLFQQQQQLQQVKCPTITLLGDDPNVLSSVSHRHNKKKPRHVRRWSDIPPRSTLHNSIAFEAKLKDDRYRSRLPETANSSTVRFNTVVSVVQIPSRNQYSKRIKQSLWRDRDELSEMVERNMEEFRAENFDWRSVVLDDDMYVDSTNGELVHPCHVPGANDDFGVHDEKEEVSALDDDSFLPLTRANSLPAQL